MREVGEGYGKSRGLYKGGHVPRENGMGWEGEGGGLLE